MFIVFHPIPWGKKNTFIYITSLPCYGFFYVAMETFHFLSRSHTWAKMEYTWINTSFQNPTCKISSPALSVQWGRTILDSVFVNHGFIQKLFSIPFPPGAHGPRGWGYFPRHSASVIVRCYYSFCPFCLLVFNDKKRNTLFVFLKPLAQISATNFVTDN